MTAPLYGAGMPISEDLTVHYRPATPEDKRAIAALDNSFTTDTVIEVTVSEDGFRLRTVPVDPPLRKVYPEHDDDPEGNAHLIVAHDGSGPCGVITFVHQEWNNRLWIADLRVSPAHRGRGIGRELMERALARGRELGAHTAGLEVTSINAPAVRAYRRLGFTVTGLDSALYTGTVSEGECALFMSRPLN